MALELKAKYYLQQVSFLRNALIVCIAAAVAITSSLILMQNPTQAAASDDFVTTWQTDKPGGANSTSITIGASGGGYDYDIDWNNDGVFDEFNKFLSTSHDYGVAGTYTVRIRGTFPRPAFNNSKIVRVDQWGTGVWASMENAFADTSGLTITATDAPNLSAVTSMHRMFAGATNIHGDISGWDTSGVTDMSDMFNASSFNQNLSTWDTSSVTNMVSMFNSSSFNQDISAWNTSSVANMAFMFYYAPSFNQDISTWDTGNVTNMSGMFGHASSFNQDISVWNTSKVTNMSSMFNGETVSSAFNQDIGDWDMSSVTDASWMLYGTPLSVDNYDAILKKWSQQVLQQGLSFRADGLEYCTADSARKYIIDNFGWQITGDTRTCDLLLDGVPTQNQTNPTVYIKSGLSTGGVVGAITNQNFDVRATNPYVLTCDSPGTGDGYFTIGGATGSDLLLAQPLTYDANGNNNYDVCIQAINTAGSKLDVHFTISVVGKPVITSAQIVDENGKKVLIVNGQYLVNEANWEIDDAYERSLVTLNTTALPFCTSTTPDNAATVESWGYDPAYFSDVPTCYEIYDNDYNTLLTSTEARIELAADFDTTAEGSVSVNGSDTFTFNAQSGNEITAGVGGDELTGTPTISKRPTFSGTAPVGSTVTVTVHSDPVVCTAIADVNGNWSCTLPSDLVPGYHTVSIRVVEVGGAITDLGPYTVFVAGGAGTTINNSTPLAPDTGFLQQINQAVATTARSPWILVLMGATALSLGITVVYVAKKVMYHRRIRT